MNVGHMMLIKLHNHLFHSRDPKKDPDRPVTTTNLVKLISSGSGNRELIIRLHDAIWCTEDRGFVIC